MSASYVAQVVGFTNERMVISHPRVFLGPAPRTLGHEQAFTAAVFGKSKGRDPAAFRAEAIAGEAPRVLDRSGRLPHAQLRRAVERLSRPAASRERPPGVLYRRGRVPLAPLGLSVEGLAWPAASREGAPGALDRERCIVHLEATEDREPDTRHHLGGICHIIEILGCDLCWW